MTTLGRVDSVQRVKEPVKAAHSFYANHGKITLVVLASLALIAGLIALEVKWGLLSKAVLIAMGNPLICIIVGLAVTGAMIYFAIKILRQSKTHHPQKNAVLQRSPEYNHLADQDDGIALTINSEVVDPQRAFTAPVIHLSEAELAEEERVLPTAEQRLSFRTGYDLKPFFETNGIGVQRDRVMVGESIRAINRRCYHFLNVYRQQQGMINVDESILIDNTQKCRDGFALGACFYNGYYQRVHQHEFLAFHKNYTSLLQILVFGILPESHPRRAEFIELLLNSLCDQGRDGNSYLRSQGLYGSEWLSQNIVTFESIPRSPIASGTIPPILNLQGSETPSLLSVPNALSVSNAIPMSAYLPSGPNVIPFSSYVDIRPYFYHQGSIQLPKSSNEIIHYIQVINRRCYRLLLADARRRVDPTRSIESQQSDLEIIHTNKECCKLLFKDMRTQSFRTEAQKVFYFALLKNVVGFISLDLILGFQFNASAPGRTTGELIRELREALELERGYADIWLQSKGLLNQAWLDQHVVKIALPEVLQTQVDSSEIF